MEPGLFISLLNPAIALVLASAFLMLWLYQRHRPHLAVLGVAYSASAAGFLTQHFPLPIGQAVNKLLTNTFFTFAVLCLASAIIARYGRRVPYVALGVLGAGGLIGLVWFLFVEPNFTWRIYAVNFAFGGISLLVAAELRAIPDKGPTERILLVLALLCGLNFIVRTLVAISIHGVSDSYTGFSNSLYWTTALLSHAILSLLIALCLITAAALDVLKALQSESHTDPLSGLLNRRGFETAASQALELSAAHGVPVALVIADLDHFKSVNDTFGHDAGDKVIAGFAERLRMAAGVGGIAGRIGGEEFAVLLTATDLGAARLFAEGVRASFSECTICGVPAAARITASFGVASLSGDEGLSALLRRADDALYHAKKGGRDRVRLSYQRAADVPPQERLQRA